MGYLHWESVKMFEDLAESKGSWHARDIGGKTFSFGTRIDRVY